MPYGDAIKEHMSEILNKNQAMRHIKKGPHSYFYKGTTLYQQKDRSEPEIFLDMKTSAARTIKVRELYFSKDGSMVTLSIAISRLPFFNKLNGFFFLEVPTTNTIGMYMQKPIMTSSAKIFKKIMLKG